MSSDPIDLLAASVGQPMTICGVAVFENRSSRAFRRDKVELLHGSFHVEHLPVEAVPPHSTAVVAVHSLGFLVGVEFSLSFSADSARVALYACAPFIGSPIASITSLLHVGIDARVLIHFDAPRRLWLFRFVLVDAPAPSNAFVTRWRGVDLPIARPEHRPEFAIEDRTKGQVVVLVRDCEFPAPPAPAGSSDARSFFYVQVLRVRNKPPIDCQPPPGVRLLNEAAAAAYVGQHRAVLEPLFWSAPQYVRPSERPLFDEQFVVNVDDVLRDGCCVRLIESLLFGAKQRVVAERTILAAHVLPDAQRRALATSLGEQLARLEHLSGEYAVLYAAETHMLERLRMKRDIDALKEALLLLDDAQRAAPRVNGIGAQCSFVSTELSAPSDLQHSLHIGIDRDGRFTTRNIPADWQRVFEKAGVLRQEIDDHATFSALMATIGDLAPLSATPHGAASSSAAPAPDDGEVVVAASEPSLPTLSAVSPKHWFARRARIAATLALEIDVSGLAAEDRPADAETAARLRRRRALLAAASAAACNASERESDLAVAAAVAAKAAMYGRAADQAMVLLGGSPRDQHLDVDLAELDADAGDELSSSFSEDVINAERLPNVSLLPPRIAMHAPSAAADAPLAVTLTPPPEALRDEFEGARLSMLDQIRQGMSLRASSALPKLAAVGNEDALVDALRAAVMRRRTAMKASTD